MNLGPPPHDFVARRISVARRKRWLSLSVASLATLLVTADAGQLSIALPAILAFNADLTLASWIALVYALITASLFTLREIVGSCRNRKSIQCRVCSLCGQCSGCGMVSKCGQLILFRALQAAGSALIMANNFALVTALFPPEERGRAMAYQAERSRRLAIHWARCSADYLPTLLGGVRICIYRRCLRLLV